MKPFVPHPLPPVNIEWDLLVGLLGRANRAIARYDGMLQNVVNPAILLSPLTTQEAVLSSKIEGTQATLDEVLEHEAGQSYDEEKTQDIQEVVNYRRALTMVDATLESAPLTLSLMLHLHAVLMDSVRGKDKSPGEFRKNQNWLGKPGCSIEEATFVPPNPLQLLDHLQAWEAYVHGDEKDCLAQAAIMHAQFEIIHPFNDGNGRMGRLLIPMFLYQKRVLSSPMFYLSEYLEANREEYYACLKSISQQNHWNRWIEFFLLAIIDQAKSNLDKVIATLALYEKMKQRIADITHSQHSIRLLDAIFDRPVFQAGDLVKQTGLSDKTLARLLKKLKDDGVLKSIRESSGSRPAILAFPDLLNITEGRKVLS